MDLTYSSGGLLTSSFHINFEDIKSRLYSKAKIDENLRDDNFPQTYFVFMFYLKIVTVIKVPNS